MQPQNSRECTNTALQSGRQEDAAAACSWMAGVGRDNATQLIVNLPICRALAAGRQARTGRGSAT